MKLHTRNGYTPHPSWGDWHRFLSRHCEVRGKADGVVWFGATNCNYFVFPDGLIIENYGYHGKALMREIETDGAGKVRARIDTLYNEIQETLRWINTRKEQP